MLKKRKSFETALHVVGIGDFLKWWTSCQFVTSTHFCLSEHKTTQISLNFATQIHEGTSCDTHADVLGHYYDTSVDPWTTTWISDSNGNGFGTFVVEAGYDVTQNINRTIVTHLSGGTRSGCGVLSASNVAQSTFDCTVTATDLSVYPDYAGSIEARGVVVVTDASYDSLELRYDISGLEASASGTLILKRFL